MTASRDRDDDLTALAFETLKANLERYGNVLSDAHAEALRHILWRFTALASGTSDHHRYGYDLPCGGGKTEAAKAWCFASWNLGRRYSVAISAAKVEALCELKRGLIAMGVPERDIGLIHSYGAKASLPATVDNEGRLILLLSHSKLRGPRQQGMMPTYQGAPRSLMIYDESLIIADTRSVSVRALAQNVGWLSGELEAAVKPTREAIVTHAFGRHFLDDLKAELASQRAGNDPRPVELADIPEEYRQLFLSVLKEPTGAALRALVMAAPATFRVLETSDGGVCWFDLVIPDELSPVCVLDASLVVRPLPRVSALLRQDDAFDGRIKDHSDVVVRQMWVNSGRGSLEGAFAARRENRDVSKEIVDVVRSIPDDEGIIIFSFKSKVGRGKGVPDILEVLKGDLEAAGIDTAATVKVKGEDKPRFVWMTWGSETGINDHAYASNVILAGVLHRSDEDLASAIVGQKKDLRAAYRAELAAVKRGEIAHVVYQALCRGSCRHSRDGKALPMKAWVMHPHRDLSEDIQNLAMQGVQWLEWEPKHLKGTAPRKTQEIASRVAAYLADRTEKISTRAIKKALGLDQEPARTFTNALSLVVEMSPGWSVEGRSMVPVGSA